MSFLDAARIAANQNWAARIQMIALDVAIDVLAEPVDAPDHAQRAALAQLVLRGDQTVLSALPKVALTNETVRAGAVADVANFGAAVPDNDLLYTLTTTWTSVAKSLTSV